MRVFQKFIERAVLFIWRVIAYNRSVLRSSFAQIFPVPSLLLFSSVGLDISDQSIKFAELTRSSRGVVLKRYGSVSIPQGVIYSGKIQDHKKLADILSELKRKQNLKNVRVSLPEEQVYVFELKIPKVPYKQIRSTIELSIEEHIPVKANEVSFDFAVVNQTETEYTIQVSAMPSELIEGYESVFQEAGIVPLSFELEAQAIARAVVRKGDLDTCMIVDFGETRTGISVVSGGSVVFATTLDLGGRSLTTSMAKAFSIPFDKAEEKKKAIGLSRRPEDKEEFAVLLYGISILRDEINKNFIYWHSHKDETGKDHPQISEIFLVGGDANLIGLPEYLTASLRTHVLLANPWVNVNSFDKYVPIINARDVLGYVTALGLALGDYEYD